MVVRMLGTRDRAASTHRNAECRTKCASCGCQVGHALPTAERTPCGNHFNPPAKASTSSPRCADIAWTAPPPARPSPAAELPQAWCCPTHRLPRRSRQCSQEPTRGSPAARRAPLHLASRPPQRNHLTKPFGGPCSTGLWLPFPLPLTQRCAVATCRAQERRRRKAHDRHPRQTSFTREARWKRALWLVGVYVFLQVCCLGMMLWWKSPSCAAQPVVCLPPHEPAHPADVV